MFYRLGDSIYQLITFQESNTIILHSTKKDYKHSQMYLLKVIKSDALPIGYIYMCDSLDKCVEVTDKDYIELLKTFVL